MRYKIIIILLIMFLATSCATEEQKEAEEREITNIDKYLASGVEYDVIDKVFRIVTKEIETEVMVEKGDSVYINYSMYTFGNPKGIIFATNIEAVAIANKNILVIDEDKSVYQPKKIKYGETPMLSGFSMGILGAKEGSSYQLIVPFEYGYGNKQEGSVPPYTTLFIEFDIVEIKKQNDI